MSKHQTYKHSPSDSDSEICDVSSGHLKELTEGKPYRRKGILDKMSTLSKKGHPKYKGKFSTIYNMF